MEFPLSKHVKMYKLEGVHNSIAISAFTNLEKSLNQHRIYHTEENDFCCWFHANLSSHYKLQHYYFHILYHKSHPIALIDTVYGARVYGCDHYALYDSRFREPSVISKFMRLSENEKSKLMNMYKKDFTDMVEDMKNDYEVYVLGKKIYFKGIAKQIQNVGTKFIQALD